MFDICRRVFFLLTAVRYISTMYNNLFPRVRFHYFPSSYSHLVYSAIYFTSTKFEKIYCYLVNSRGTRVRNNRITGHSHSRNAVIDHFAAMISRTRPRRDSETDGFEKRERRDPVSPNHRAIHAHTSSLKQYGE